MVTTNVKVKGFDAKVYARQIYGRLEVACGELASEEGGDGDDQWNDWRCWSDFCGDWAYDAAQPNDEGFDERFAEVIRELKSMAKFKAAQKGLGEIEKREAEARVKRLARLEMEKANDVLRPAEAVRPDEVVIERVGDGQWQAIGVLKNGYRQEVGWAEEFGGEYEVSVPPAETVQLSGTERKAMAQLKKMAMQVQIGGAR